MKCMVFWGWHLFSNECSLHHSIIARISPHQWTYVVTSFDSFSESTSLSICCFVLACVGQTWLPLLGLFTRNIVCDILIGWSCSGNWQQPWTLSCTQCKLLWSTGDSASLKRVAESCRGFSSTSGPAPFSSPKSCSWALSCLSGVFTLHN